MERKEVHGKAMGWSFWALSLVEKPETIVVEDIFPNSDGEEKIYDSIIFPIREEDTDLNLYGGISFDVTEKKRAESQLRLQAAMLRHVSDAIISTDMDLNVMSWNNAATEMYGWSESEVFGQPIDRLLQTEFVSVNQVQALEVIEKTGLWKGEVRQRTKDGRDLYVECSVSWIRDSSGQVVGGVTVNRDIGFRKQGENLLKTRLFLRELAPSLSLKELMAKTLDESERLTGSRIGFFHVVSPDGKNVSLQTWSSSTAKIFRAEEFDRQYPLSEVGILADCIREKRPAICNGNGNLFDCGLPFPEDLVVERMMIAPIFQGDTPVAVFGLANKGTDYTEQDIEVVSQLAGMAWDFSFRKRTESELRRLASAIDQVDEAIVITDAGRKILYVNPAYERITGYSRADAVGRNPDFMKSEIHEASFYDGICETLDAGKSWRGFLNLPRKGGKGFMGDAALSPVRDESGIIVNYVAVLRDISNQLKVERQLRQAQKMEAIGVLAGGIAHDFNNILFIIMGYVEFLEEDVPENSPLLEYIDVIMDGVTRAKELVAQILTFSRQSEQSERPVRIQTILKETMKMIRSTLPSTINIREQIDNQCMPVLADPTQIHQVVLNLVTNAFHAMENTGGQLAVSLAMVDSDSDTGPAVPPPSGKYARLSVSDTGSGIAPENKDKIFEPYFTTKEIGMGTGMGLSVVHGIVKGSGGNILVESETGKGSTFHLFFPVYREICREDAANQLEPVPTGNEHILFIDDENVIAEMGKDLLQRLGYRVTVRTSSIEALELFKVRPDRFDLVVTDLTMPGMTGDRLVREMRKSNPSIPIILCTGFADKLNEKKAEELGVAILVKPIARREFAVTIRELLGSSRKKPKAVG